MVPDTIISALFANKYRIVSRVLQKTGYDVRKTKPEKLEQASFYAIEEKIKIKKNSDPVKFWLSHLFK